jgi:hypothetical protein
MNGKAGKALQQWLYLFILTFQGPEYIFFKKNWPPRKGGTIPPRSPLYSLLHIVPFSKIKRCTSGPSNIM